MKLRIGLTNIENEVIGKRQSTLSHILHNKVLYLLLLPGIAYYLIFLYLPMYGVVIAFKDFNMFSGIISSEWVGLKHFITLFSSDTFFKVFRNSLMINLYKIIFNFPVPVILAILLNEIRSIRFKRTIQTAIYLPYFLSWVVIAGLVISFLSPSTGVINMLIKSFGGEPVNFLANKNFFVPIIILSDLWHSMGWSTIIFLAALTGIGPELYDSAKIDGAGRFKQILNITIPGIKSTIVVLLLLKVGNIMNNGFEQIFLLYNPMVYDVGDVFETYVYRIGLVEARYDFATAIGLFKSSVGFILLIIANFIARKSGEKGIF